MNDEDDARARTSDEATGLPPLEEIEGDVTLVLLAWAGSSGIVSGAVGGADGSAVRFLHCRGVIEDGDGGVEWAQIHLAVPVEHAVDVAATLAKGTTEELG